MDSRDVATFFALMLLGGAVAVVAAQFRPTWRAAMSESAPVLAAVVAASATAGSLYFSEIADFVPCQLCWYQRIAMYPLALILPVALWRRDHFVAPYALALGGIGLSISLYHVQLQLFPSQSTFCDATDTCAGRWVEAFGWMTIPQMAGISFALILALTAMSYARPTEETT